jgi:hypothetical protein
MILGLASRYVVMFHVPHCHTLRVSVQLFQAHLIGSPYTVPVHPSRPCAHASSLDERSLCGVAGQTIAMHLQVGAQVMDVCAELM